MAEVGKLNIGQGNRFRRQQGVVVKPKDFKGTLRRLWGITQGQRQGLGIIFLLSIVAAVIVMSTPYLIGRVIDSLQGGDLSIGLLVVLAGIYIGDYLSKFIQGYMMAVVSQRMIKYIRKMLFAYFNALPLAFFDKKQHGDLMSRLTNDIDNISNTISDSLTQLMQLACTIVGVLCIMLVLNIPLTAVTLVVSPLIYFLTKAVTKHTKVLFKKQQEVLGKLNGHVEESISGNMIVKAYGMEENMIQEFEVVNERLREVGTKALVWSGLLMPFMNVINNLSFIFVAILGGVMATKGYITVGLISTFLLYARQFTRPLNEMANIYNTLQTAVAGAERIFEIFDEQTEEPDVLDAKILENPVGEIVFEDVCFGYEYGKPILNHINLTIAPGTKIAIVGPTGAGKTTIINLLTRFYDITSGRILLDGIDLRNYKRADLRKAFSVVLQDTELFQMSILENIRYGNKAATNEEVIAAAKSAHAHGFIERLPLKYDTIIGAEANTLSQGEKQLLTIARAVLTNAPIMILDEATSSVDTRTEKRIKKAMENLTKGRTSIFIAHRLSTIRDCYIIVLDQGQITEMGTHEELLEQKGGYYKMYQTQTGTSSLGAT